MVAMKSPGLAETYKALCAYLRENPSLSIVVSNHIAAKHQIHSLPAFHTSDAVKDDDKLATYGEIVTALTEKNYKGLKGQVAGGQAAAAEDPPEEEDRIRTVMRPDEPAKPRVQLTKRTDVLPEVKPEPPAPAPVVAKVKPPVPSDPITDRLRELLREIIGELPAAMDEEKVTEIADASASTVYTKTLKQVHEDIATAMKSSEDTITSNVSKLIDTALKSIEPGRPSITVHEFKVGEAVTKVEGAIHRQLPQIVAWLMADVPVWLWGQAGGGKTHLARQAAQALGTPFHCAPIDETITVGKLVGFRNVSNGEFVKGLMYEAFKSGGVQLLDEIDTNATAIASTNSLTANGHYTFPNGEEVPRHADFRLIAGANTKGTGAVAGYTARIRMDAATLDRFAVIKLDYDPGLELALACGQPNKSAPWQPSTPATPEQCQRYVEWVQKVRQSAGDSVLISPRASYLGVRALRVGIPLAEVVEALVFKLVAPDTKARLVSACGSAY